MADSCTEDVVWGSYENSAVPFAGNYHGKKGVVEFFTALAGSVDYTDFQPKEFNANGDYVFVKGFHQAVVKSTGKTFGHNFLMEF